MRILILCSFLEKELIKRILVRNNVAGPLNIFFVHEFEKAQAFLDQQLVSEGGHIDLVIVTGTLSHDRDKTHFVDRLRYSYQSFSKKNFKLKALPVIYYAKEIRQTDYYEYGYNARVEMSSNNDHSSLLKTIKSVVKSFREKLHDDLELLRIDMEELQLGHVYEFDPYYYLKIKSDPIHWASRTSILSANFIEYPRRLNYDWLNQNEPLVAASIERYEDILKSIKKYNRKNSEKTILHKLFNDSPWILQTDIYNKPIYEPSLMKNQKQYEEPDYILPSAMPGLIPNNVTEVKLPTMELLHRRRRKPGLKSGFTDALMQLGYYRRHITRNDGKDQVAGLVDNNGTINYTLLASCEEERERDRKLLEEILQDHFRGLKFETHHERLEEAKKYYERKFWCN